MKSRLFVLLLTALFIVGNVFAGTPLEDELVLKGEFSQIGVNSITIAIIYSNYFPLSIHIKTTQGNYLIGSPT